MPPPVHFPGGDNMAIKASRNDVWMAVIDDRAGGAADKLETLAKAGADLEIVFARRTPEHPGQGILFAGPIEGAKVTRAAQDAGFKRSCRASASRWCCAKECRSRPTAAR